MSFSYFLLEYLKEKGKLLHILMTRKRDQTMKKLLKLNINEKPGKVSEKVKGKCLPWKFFPKILFIAT